MKLYQTLQAEVDAKSASGNVFMNDAPEGEGERYVIPGKWFSDVKNTVMAMGRTDGGPPTGTIHKFLDGSGGPDGRVTHSITCEHGEVMSSVRKKLVSAKTWAAIVVRVLFFASPCCPCVSPCAAD